MWQALREIVERRELLLTLAGRDIRIRYKQTAMGFAWAVMMPVLMMLIFVQIFGRRSETDASMRPYAVWVYCGLLPWQFFAASMKGAVESLIKNNSLVTKIYFPREVFPLAQIVSAAVDFAVASMVLVGLMAWYGVVPGAAALLLPAVLTVQLLLMLGLSLILAMSNLFYRDVKYVFEVALLLWMFVSSVIVPVPTDGLLGRLLWFNPMVHVIEGYRAVLLDNAWPEPLGFAYAATVAVVLACVGLRVFHESEYKFAEVI